MPLDEALAPDVITTPDRPFQDIDFTLTRAGSEPGEIKTTDPEQESGDLSYAERVRRATTYRFLEAQIRCDYIVTKTGKRGSAIIGRPQRDREGATYFTLHPESSRFEFQPVSGPRPRPVQ